MVISGIKVDLMVGGRITDHRAIMEKRSNHNILIMPFVVCRQTATLKISTATV